MLRIISKQIFKSKLSPYHHPLRLLSSLNKECVVMSGIQPTGIPHLGNYLGAIRQWCRLQLDPSVSKLYLGVVDLHSLTGNPVAEQLRQNTLDMLACLYACGLDDSKTVIFQQSAVRGHTELAWILAAFCNINWLQQQPQWREKVSEQHQTPNASLLTYPILQAADVLLYRATHVPVGEDQATHMNLARDLIGRLVTHYGAPDSLLPLPKMMMCDFPRIKSLTRPEKKMSKSDVDPLSRIEITDDEETIFNKIKKSVTDSTPGISFDPVKRPNVAALIELHSSLLEQSPQTLVSSSLGSLNKRQFKALLAKDIDAELAEVRQRWKELRSRPDDLLDRVARGNLEAQARADKTMAMIRDLVGLSLVSDRSVEHDKIKKVIS